MRSARIINTNLVKDNYATPLNGSCVSVCVCGCVCEWFFLCIMSWIKLWYEVLQLMLFQIKRGERKFTLHPSWCGTRILYKRPLFLNSINLCREQETECAAKSCICSDVSTSVYSAHWYTLLFCFVLLFFLLPFSLPCIFFQVYFRWW